jgi:hypothetical protein
LGWEVGQEGWADDEVHMTRTRLLAIALYAAGWAHAAADAPEEKKSERVVGWVSDGHCGAEHMKTGGAACVRKCIAGAEHVNPEWKPGGMVFVTEDKQLWKVDNPDALWGHESEQLEVLATRDAEKKSIKVEKVVEVRQR